MRPYQRNRILLSDSQAHPQRDIPKMSPKHLDRYVRGDSRGSTTAAGWVFSGGCGMSSPGSEDGRLPVQNWSPRMDCPPGCGRSDYGTNSLTAANATPTAAGTATPMAAITPTKNHTLTFWISSRVTTCSICVSILGGAPHRGSPPSADVRAGEAVMAPVSADRCRSSRYDSPWGHGADSRLSHRLPAHLLSATAVPPVGAHASPSSGDRASRGRLMAALHFTPALAADRFSGRGNRMRRWRDHARSGRSAAPYGRTAMPT